MSALFRIASALTGPRSRLELSGLAFLRSICKLCFDGHGAYEKGDGKEISQWLREHHPDLAYISVGRVERSKRQDWAAEVAMKILPILDPLNEYLIGDVPAS